MTEQTEAPAPERPSPLELLRRNPNAITDVVYGPDHPERGRKAKAKRRNTPPQDASAAVRKGHGTLLGDTLDPNLKTKLNALKYRLERAQTRMNTGKDAS